MKRSILAATALAAAMGAGVPARAETLVLYAAQHQQLVDMLTAGFKAKTGIAVTARFGEAPEIASQIVKEGENSPADLYFTENSPELTLLDEKRLLAKVDAKTLAAIPSQYSAASGDWVGVLARENVLAYDPAKVKEADLPASLLDLARPEWKGRVAIAPTDADFLPLVKAIVELKGRAAAKAWLVGMKANAQLFEDDEGVAAAVERGTAALGIVNNYYWERLRTEKGKDGTRSRIHHFAGGDVGGLMNVSGAAVLASSKKQADAQRFLAYLVDPETQAMVAKSDVDFEYPLARGVAPNPALTPMDKLQPPKLSLRQLGDDKEAAKLLREAGLI